MSEKGCSNISGKQDYHTEAKSVSNRLLWANSEEAAQVMRDEYLKLGQNGFNSMVASLEKEESSLSFSQKHLGVFRDPTGGKVLGLTFNGQDIYDAKETTPLNDGDAQQEAVRLGHKLDVPILQASDVIHTELVQFGQKNFNKIVGDLQASSSGDEDRRLDVRNVSHKDDVASISISGKEIYSNATLDQEQSDVSKMLSSNAPLADKQKFMSQARLRLGEQGFNSLIESMTGDEDIRLNVQRDKVSNKIMVVTYAGKVVYQTSDGRAVGRAHLM